LELGDIGVGRTIKNAGMSQANHGTTVPPVPSSKYLEGEFFKDAVTK
jgi:hypothetical protein